MRTSSRLASGRIASSGVALFLGFALLALAGCGSGLRVRTAEPATGPFTNASLSGPYAFALSGTNSSGFFTTAGAFQADGNGNITSGVQDVNAATGVFTNLPVVGSYFVGADGRGTAILASQASTMTLGFVLISSQHGLVARFDTFATASGTLDRQDTTAFSVAALQGPFAFGISGVNSIGANIQSAGTFTADGAGRITSGVQDVNDNGATTSNAALTGGYTVGAEGRGTLALTTSAGTLNFATYIIDATHLKLVEIDFTPAMSGDAFRQQGTPSNASVSGPYAFTLGGSSVSGPFVAGGVFTADGNGNIISGTEDVNDASSVTTNLALTGSYAIASNSRGTLTFTTSKGASNFVIYPSTGGLQMLEMDSTVSGGTAHAQTTGAISTASIQGKYGYNLTGVTTNGPTDSIAQFAADGNGGITGAIDLNLMGSIAQNLGLAGNYSVSANGRGTATLTSSLTTQKLVLYVVSGSRVLVLSTDPKNIAVGSFEHQ